MSRTGNCGDSSVAERLFATVEHELFAHHTFTTPQAASVAFADSLAWCNRDSLHSTLDYVRPHQYEWKRHHSKRAG